MSQRITINGVVRAKGRRGGNRRSPKGRPEAAASQHDAKALGAMAWELVKAGRAGLWILDNDHAKRVMKGAGQRFADPNGEWVVEGRRPSWSTHNRQR